MSKVLTAHQPVYLPWLGLLHKIALADHFVWFDDVQYQVRDWNNRNKIKTNAGEIWLSVPVSRKNHFDIKVRDVEIDNTQAWARKHLKSIRLAYQKAPFFDRYIGFFDDLYAKQWTHLADLNRAILDFFMAEFKINVPITTLTEMNLSQTKSDLVLAMCVAHQADVYIFGAQGRNYADVAAFRAAGIEPVFQDYTHPNYAQINGPFVSHMAALDVLFNCGADAHEIMMEGNWSRADLPAGVPA